jgi:hypothetical protein
VAILVNDFIFNVLPSQGPTIWLPVLGWIPVNSPLIGSFSGVIIAYFLAKGTERYLNVQKRAKWLRIIRKELNQAHSDLVERERLAGFSVVFFAIHYEFLRTLVSSVDVSLFDANQAIALTQTYTQMENYLKHIERINKRILEFQGRASIENPEYKSLLEELGKLEENQRKGDRNLGTAFRIDALKEKISLIEGDSLKRMGEQSALGFEFDKQMKNAIETFMKQKWVMDEKWRLFFPKRMSKDDEEMIENLARLPLIPGKA